MNEVEAKEYVNQRFAELSEDNPKWPRTKVANLIIGELANDKDFILTTPTGHPIMSVHEDNEGLFFDVLGLVG